MSGFQEQLSDHAANVFLNDQHFTQSLMHYTKTGSSTQFSGVIDRDQFQHEDTDEADRDQHELLLTVAVATEANMDRQGWIAIGTDRFSIEGERDRDRDTVTLILKRTGNRAIGHVYPHDKGREVKHAGK